MYEQKAAINTTALAYGGSIIYDVGVGYWSSEESYNTNDAWMVWFSNSNGGTIDKSTLGRVRAIRAF